MHIEKYFLHLTIIQAHAYRLTGFNLHGNTGYFSGLIHGNPVHETVLFRNGKTTLPCRPPSLSMESDFSDFRRTPKPEREAVPQSCPVAHVELHVADVVEA